MLLFFYVNAVLDQNLKSRNNIEKHIQSEN